MAELFSYTIPNLFQGISQQPDAQRDPSQGEVQVNGYSSVAEGLRKREPTQTLAKVSNTDLGDVFIHSILRDSTEKYLAVISKTAIRVFDLAGTEYTVSSAVNAFNYLSTVSSAKSDIRAVSINDYTFISNAKKAPEMDAALLAPAVARPSPHEALVWVKAANYGQRYRVVVNSNAVEVATATAAVVVSGATTTENKISTAEIASKIRGGLIGGPVTALTLVGSATTLNGTINNQVTTTDEGGASLTVNVTGNGTVITAVAIGNAAGSGYRSGDKIFVARSLLQGGTDTTPVQVATVNTITAGPLTGVSIDRSGSVLHFTSNSAITIAATDARSNADITAITNSVQVFTELPTIAPNGYQVEVTGDPGNKWDGYYVEFEPRTGAGAFGEGAWVETVAPGEEYRIKASTMPHVLVRKPDNTFHFGPMDGSTIAVGVTLPKWGDRTAGDGDTAVDPSFIGKAIQDLFVFKNRLGMLADENVVLSRPGEFFEFFPETATTTLATDPIDLAAGGNRVSVLRYAIPFQDELILFSDQTQFRLSSSDTSLTASSAQITILTQYEIDTRCRPVQVGNGIVFAQRGGDWTKFREFSIRGNGTSITADAQDITQQVASYVPSGIYKIAVDDTSSSWYAISDKTGYLNRVYTHKFFLRSTGNGVERAQSSWSHWQLSGADKVLQVLAIQEELYLLSQYGTQVWLEKTSIADKTTESLTKPTQLLLDRWVSTTTDTPVAIRVPAGTYSATTNITTWTLPYTIKAKTQAWSSFSTANGGVLLGEASSGTTITAQGDWSAKHVFFGEVYDFQYRFTRFKAYRDAGSGKAAANSLRTQVRKAMVRFHETDYFEAHVMAERRDTAIYKYSGVSLGNRNSMIGGSAWNFDTANEDKRYREGVFTIPVLSKGENCIVELHNATALPCKFSTCEWVGLITGKARSMQ